MKTYSFDLTTTQKRRFYSQELFDDQLHLKKYLRMVIVVIGLFELLRVYMVEAKRETITLEGYQKWLASGLATMGSVSFVISTFKIMEKKLFNKIDVRGMIVSLSSILLAIGTFLKTYWTLQLVIQVGNLEAWLDAITISVNLGFGMALTDVIFPNCILKLLLPCSMFVGVFIAIMEAAINNQFVLIFRLVTIALYVVCLYMIKDRFRWKLFLKRIDDETWKALQTKILEEIPTSIAILDLKHGKIAYTNEEFKRWGSNPYGFFKKVANLNKRKLKEDMFKSMDFGSDIDNHSHPSINLDIFPDTMRKARTVDECLNNDSPVNHDFTQNQSMNLYDLIKELCLNHEKRYSKDNWGGAYDGIYSENEDRKVSLEIKISFIAQYPTAAIIMINDTTQRDLIVSLESNNKYKDNLLASISHELRTPLNGSLALLESAIQHEDGSKVLKEKYLIPALRSGSLLVHIINDILDYSQMGSNSIRLACQDLPIVQTLKDCYALMELQARKKGLKFSLLLHSNIPSCFVTDHNRVKQVLLNLLSNAIKFTFEGEICVEAKMNDRNSLNVNVTDTGIGINGKDIEKIFNKYNQAYQGEKITENSTGVGLGLTVAHRLAKILGPSNGQGIIIQSEPGKGSTFSFNISRKISPKLILNSFPDLEQFKIEDIASSSVNEFANDVVTPAVLLDNGLRYSFSPQTKANLLMRRNSLPGKSFEETEPFLINLPEILIVDDDPFNVLALESLLKPFRVQTDSAFNGEEAIKKVIKRKELENHYKLIIMDFNMPVMDGHKATRILKDMMKKGTLPDIQVIGCTAFNTIADIEEGMTSGMSEVIIKPVAKNKLAPILQRYLGISESAM